VKKGPNIEQHLSFAKSTNQLVWQLLEKKRRTAEEEEMMIESAHASYFHWLKAGSRTHHQRGLWLISRVYAVVKDASNSLQYARKCLELTKRYPKEMRDFDLAYAYEANARASFLSKRNGDGKKFFALAKTAGEKISDPEDKKIFLNDFKFNQLMK
jgi:hypothetical protein